MRRILLIVALLACIAGGTLYGGSLALYAFSAAKPGSTTSAFILIQKGQSPNEIAKSLETEGAIFDAASFLAVGKWTRQWKHIKAGEYKVSGAMSPLDIFGVITSGVSVVHPLTIREGENMYEVAADLASKKLSTKEAFLGLCRDPEFIASLGLDIPVGANTTLEGYLFPDTYNLNITMKPEDIIRLMVKRFLSAWTVEETAGAKRHGLTRHQTVILASMVEKETGASKERGLISSVFHNRLKKGMKLQSDPTTIYGMWERYKGNIRRSDLLDPSPFNTYVIPSLPAGPISNPGKEAIMAALNPTGTNFLYFVSHNDGTSEFSATLEAHNRAVRKFQIDPGSRQGHSWRELNKK